MHLSIRISIFEVSVFDCDPDYVSKIILRLVVWTLLSNTVSYEVLVDYNIIINVYQKHMLVSSKYFEFWMN